MRPRISSLLVVCAMTLGGSLETALSSPVDLPSDPRSFLIWGMNKVSATWYPPMPLANRPSNFYAESLAGAEEYKVNLTRVFASNPDLARIVCAWSELQAPSKATEGEHRMREVMTGICRSYPTTYKDRWKAVEQVDPVVPQTSDDAQAQRRLLAGAWFNARFEYELTEASKLSPAIRRQESRRLIEEIEKGTGSVERFGKVLRVIALRPQDERGAFFAIRLQPEAGYGPPGIKPDQTRDFIDRIYRTKLPSSDGKRGLRAYLLYLGEMEAARKVARGLVGTKPEEKARDALFLALLDHLSGSGVELQKLLDDCPAADLDYIESFGAPQMRAHFCQDVVAGIAARGLQLLEGRAVAPSLSEVFVTTNRLSSRGIYDFGEKQPVFRVEVSAEEARKDAASKLSAKINAELTRVASMRPEQRQEEFDELLFSQSGTIPSIEIRMMALLPSRDEAYWHFVRALPLGLTPDSDIQFIAEREVLKTFLEQKAATSSAWKEGLRSYLTYTGEFERALELDRQLAGVSKHPIWTLVHTGVLERIFGEERPFRAAVDKCPDPEQDLCWRYAGELGYRIAYFRGRSTPIPIREVLRESFEAIPNWDVRNNVVLGIKYFDPQEARGYYERMLSGNKPALSRHARGFILHGAQQLAGEQKDHRLWLAYIDEELKLLDVSRPPISAETWKTLKTDSAEVLAGDEIADALSRRAAVATQLGDWTEATRSLEWLAADSERSGWQSAVRSRLLELALAEAKRERKQAAGRILGYVQSQPLEDYDRALVVEIKRVLAGKGKLPTDIELFETPWETKSLPPVPTKKGKAT